MQGGQGTAFKRHAAMACWSLTQTLETTYSPSGTAGGGAAANTSSSGRFSAHETCHSAGYSVRLPPEVPEFSQKVDFMALVITSQKEMELVGCG